MRVVLLPPRDPRGESLATVVAAIRASRQAAPVYIYGERTAECLRELMPLARAGARGVVIRDVDDDVTALRRLLDGGDSAAAIDAVTDAVSRVVSPRHLPLVLACLERVGESASATVCARRLGVSRRTLSAWARHLGVRGVRALASSCRVLVAIAFLRNSTRSIEHVALSLRFSSSAHLHNTIRRYTGLSPRDAAGHDLEWWCRRLLAPRAVQPTLPPPAAAPLPPAEWSFTPNDDTFHPRTLTQ